MRPDYRQIAQQNFWDKQNRVAFPLAGPARFVREAFQFHQALNAERAQMHPTNAPIMYGVGEFWALPSDNVSGFHFSPPVILRMAARAVSTR